MLPGHLFTGIFSFFYILLYRVVNEWRNKSLSLLCPEPGYFLCLSKNTKLKDGVELSSCPASYQQTIEKKNLGNLLEKTKKNDIFTKNKMKKKSGNVQFFTQNQVKRKKKVITSADIQFFEQRQAKSKNRHHARKKRKKNENELQKRRST